jgi:hypothetical protein
MTRARANPDQVLQTGRLAYGDDGTNQYPVKVDSSGNITIGASTASIIKTVQTELMASSVVAASTMVKSSELSLTGIKQATFFIDHGRATTVAFGALGGTNYIIQGSEKAIGNDTWRALTTFVCSSAAASSALSSGAVAPLATTITILSGTAFVENDLIMWANTAAPSTSTEWARVMAVATTVSFTVLDPVTYAQGSTVVITNQAEHFVHTLNTRSLVRARVVVNNTAGTTAIIRSRIAAITEV